jgi:hypothetical protein
VFLSSPHKFSLILLSRSPGHGKILSRSSLLSSAPHVPAVEKSFLVPLSCSSLHHPLLLDDTLLRTIYNHAGDGEAGAHTANTFASFVLVVWAVVLTANSFVLFVSSMAAVAARVLLYSGADPPPLQRRGSFFSTVVTRVFLLYDGGAGPLPLRR